MKPYPLHSQHTSATRRRKRPELAVVLLASVFASASVMAQFEQPAAEPPPVVPSPAALANPAIRAALERPRNEPGDYLWATLNLLDLGEPELAANVFRELSQLELSDDARANLVKEFGAASMLRLARARELGPDAATFVDAAMSAAAADAISPQRMQQLLVRLASDNPNQQQNAVAELAGLGQPATLPLVRALGDESSSESLRRGARAALIRLGPLAEGPLLAALRSGGGRLPSEAAELLATLGTPQAAPLLALPALQSSSGSTLEQAYVSLTGQHPSIESVTGLITRTLDSLEAGVPAFSQDDSGKVTYWVWNGKPVNDQKPVPLVLSVADANLLYQAELASDLAALRPGVPSLESQARRLGIESVNILGGDRAPPALGDLSADALDRLLSDSLAENQVASAILALDVIAERRDPAVLQTADGRPSPTARALKHPHPNVRSAALVTIGAIDSPGPFPGSSYVCPAIVRLATATGQREVIAGAPQFDAAATWAGGLSALGFVGQIAATGAGVIELGQQRADVELILLDMAIGGPAIRDTVFQLRRQPSTALVPIGLFAREPQLPTARRIAFEHQGVVAFPRPHSEEALAVVADDLLALLPRDWPTAQQRLEQADEALAVMNQLLAEGRSFYRLRAASGMIARSAGSNAADTARWQVLAKLGTQDSQQALLDYANAPTFDMAARRAAVDAFDDSVKRFGVLLVTDEITRQYDLYNASAVESKETQQVLGALLDTIEAGRDRASNSTP